MFLMLLSLQRVYGKGCDAIGISAFCLNVIGRPARIAIISFTPGFPNKNHIGLRKSVSVDKIRALTTFLDTSVLRDCDPKYLLN